MSNLSVNAHIDLNIIEKDLALDDIFSPAQLTKQQVVAQDIKHRIVESGLLVRLIRQRNVNQIADILTEIELVVEQDDRLIPGTVKIVQNVDFSISVLAQTKLDKQTEVENAV